MKGGAENGGPARGKGDGWGITAKSTLEEVRVALCDAKMENTRDHTVTSYLGRIMIDSEDMSAEELWRMYDEPTIN